MADWITLGSLYAADTAAVQRAFAELPERCQERVLKPLLEKAARLVAAAERSEAPKETGLLGASLGASATRTYRHGEGSSKIFIAVGVRRGFRRTVAMAARGKRLKFARGSRPQRGDEGVRNPSLYLHLVTGGRKALQAGRGTIFHSANDRYFTRAAGVTPDPFMSRAFD